MTASALARVDGGAPAPLIGREAELERLLAALRAPDRGVVVLRGAAGSGKTRLADAAVERLRRDRVLVGAGKYGEGATQSPLSPITQALSALTDQALEELYDPQAGVAQMSERLKADLDVLVQAGFRGGGVRAATRLSAPAGRRAGVARVTNAAVKLLRWLSGFGLPMLLVIDDWWRATDEANRLIAALAAEEVDFAFTLLLLERSESPSSLEVEGVARRVLTLGALGAEHSLELMRRCLRDDRAGDVVARWFGEHCPRLPFEIVQTARALEESGALVQVEGEWTVDDARAASLGAPALTLGIGRRIGALGSEARDLAIAAALWSDAPPLEGLRSALGLSSARLADGVRELGQAGLTSRAAGDALRFNHDRLREEVRRQARTEEVRDLARAMADRLSAASKPPDGADWRVTALHLRWTAGLDDADPAVWRDRFARGALDARRRADLDAAVLFAEAAWTLRQRARGDDPSVDQLLLHEAVLSAADRQSPDAVWARTRLLIDGAASDLDALGEAFVTGFRSMELAGHSERAWGLASEALERFGVKAPSRITRADLMLAVLQWRLSRRSRSRSADVAYADGLTRIGEAAATLAFERSPAHAALVALRSAAKTVHSTRSAAFWSSVNAFLYSMLGDYDAAARCGEVALARLDDARGGRAAIQYRAYYFGVIWKRPARDLRRFCPEIHDQAMAEGDLNVAGNALRNAVTLAWRGAPCLDDVRTEANLSIRGLIRLGEPAPGAPGEFAPPGRVRDVQDVLAFVETLAGPAEAGPLAYSPLNPLLRLEWATVRGDWTGAAREATALRSHRAEFDNHPGGVDWRFHDCLTTLKAGRVPPRADFAFLKRQARLNPGDHRAKPLVMAAERLRLQGRRDACLNAYALAVEAAEACASRLEAGLAARCAAEAAAAFQRPDLERRYRERADAIWRSWGAYALVSEGPARAPVEAEPGDDLAGRLVEAEAHATSAERSDRAKSRFLTTVAHELRTPMQGMQSLLDLAAEAPEGFDVAQFREVFGSLKVVIDDLTDFGALSAGAVQSRLAPVSLPRLIASESAMIRPLMPTAALRILDDPALPDPILADSARLRQVIRNLLSNAVKYAHGAPVTIRTEFTPPDGRGAASVTVHVEDGGPGIADQDLVRIFEPFERGARTGAIDGLGLGLALSRRIAESLGGTLVAANRAEGGAAFRFSFPAEAAAAEFDAGEVDDAPAPGRGLPLLLAEDVPLTRALIRDLLERDGHAVTAVADGLEALVALDRQRFALAFLDLGMPSAGGAEVMDELERRGDHTPVVILTAASQLDEGAASATRRAAAVLRKPVTARELRAVIASAADAGLALSASVTASDPQSDLTREAGREVRRLSRELLESLGGVSHSPVADPAEAAHRLAGLAYQFGWAEAGAAAEAVETALTHEPTDLPTAMGRLRRATAGDADARLRSDPIRAC